MPSESETRVAANIAEAVGFTTAAQKAITAGDYLDAAKFIGEARDFLGACITDVIDLAGDPVQAQAAFDEASAGDDG